MGEWVVMKEPTVDELGEKRRECKRCGASQRRTIDKLHSHKWETGWLDSEIATDRNGKKIGINMCAKCFAYFGSPDNDEWVVRYWDHCDNVHDTGYSSYPVYAYYDIEWCPGCDGKNRLGFAYYAYLDYSVSNKVGTIILEPWQVEELNLPLR